MITTRNARPDRPVPVPLGAGAGAARGLLDQQPGFHPVLRYARTDRRGIRLRPPAVTPKAAGRRFSRIKTGLKKSEKI